MSGTPTSTSVALLAIGLFSVSCNAPVYDRAAILRDAADHVIVPGYAALADDAEAMNVAAEALCAAPSTAGLTAARDAWTTAFASFEHTTAFGIGPARDMNLSSEMGFWPISPTTIERNVAATEPIDALYVDALGAGAKGMLAIAYLLWGGTADATWTPPTEDAVVAGLVGTPRRCAYLVALTDHAARTSRRLSDAWSPAGGDYAGTLARAGQPGNAVYPDASTALVALITQMLETLKLAKNTKLGIPIGHRTTIRAPGAVQSPFADGSVLAMRENVAGVVELWTAGDGEGLHSCAGLVASRDPDLASLVRGQLEASVAGLAALDRVLVADGHTFSAYAATADTTVAETAYTRIDLAEATIATQVASLLGLNIAFSDMDGD